MLSWFDKKERDESPAEASASAPAGATPGEREADGANWTARLQAAQGDDEALLALAQAAPVLSVKLAAVEALADEAALRQAERAFRNHDRRVHSLAKRRHDQAVARRESRERAAALIDTALTMTTDDALPVNHLAALDRDWQAIDPVLLDVEQRTRFAELREVLAAQVRGRAEHLQQVQRWNADARVAQADLRRALEHAAADGHPIDLDAPLAAVRALLDARPDNPSTVAAAAALQSGAALASAVKVRLDWLEAAARPATRPVPAVEPGAVATPAPAAQVEPGDLPEPTAGPGPATQADPLTGEAGAVEPEANAVAPEAATEAGVVPPDEPAELPVESVAWAAGESPVSADAWNHLPAVSDAGLSRLLAQRFEAWRAATLRAQAAAAAAAARPSRSVVSPEERAALAVKLRKLDARLQQADAVLADGHLDELQRHLQGIDSVLATLAGVGAADRHRAHRQSLQAEFGRLRSWQKWGGGRARDDLVAEAENLARATVAAAEPGAAGSVRLNVKAHADAIAGLRQRWKALDRTGGAPDPALWQRFDAALTLAHQPVAAQQAALKAARQENLRAREALLDALEAVPEIPDDAPAEALAVQRKQQLAALEQFRAGWRKLGPPEHTVPAKARETLEQRMKAAVERIEAPLHEARRAAAGVREELVVQAQALIPELERGLPMREAAARVRDLQARWQREARALPLARGVENALWTRFKAATDAVFAHRDQAEKARDAEIAGHIAAAEALVARLESLNADTPAGEIRSTMAEVDRAWREGTPLPRAAAQAIVARYEAARTAAQQHLAGSALKRWRDQCDALAARLVLCEQREAGEAADEELQQRWGACGAVPAILDKPLAERWARAGGSSGPLAAAALDDLLLQLEAAFGLPPAPEQEAARRQLKLLAMKQALEGRKAGEAGPARHAEWLAAVSRQAGTTPQQRERLHALVAALRRGTPELLGLPVPRG